MWENLAARIAGKALQKVWPAAESHLLEPHYLRSHDKYLTHKSARWESVSEDLELCIYLESTLTDERDPVSFIALRRALNGQRPIDSVELVVEAESELARYEERVVLRNVGRKPTIRYLRLIPLQEMWLLENRWFHCSYDTIRIYIERVLSEGCAILSNHCHRIYTPTYHDFLNASFARKWGHVYNLDFLERAKDDLSSSIMFSFHTTLELSLPRLSNSWWSRVRRALASFMTSRRVISVLFWTALLLRLVRIDEMGKVTCRLRWLNCWNVKRFLGLPARTVEYFCAESG